MATGKRRKPDAALQRRVEQPMGRWQAPGMPATKGRAPGERTSARPASATLRRADEGPSAKTAPKSRVFACERRPLPAA